MGEYALHLPKAESVTLSAAAADRLLRRRDGDAALLYLCILRHAGRLTDAEAREELGFTAERQMAAEETLRALELLGERETAPAAEPAEEKPDYSQRDIAEALEGDEPFRRLEAEVSRILGKRLSTSDTAILLGLYDYVSLPADVIYQLVCHCVERSERAYGPGRRPTLRQIEKEGYIWSRRGIDSQSRASAYLRTYNKRQGLLPKYMQALQLGARAPAPSEEKYLTEWIEQGVSPELAALAYDRTMLRCHELKWSYLGAILRRWNEKGLRTPEAVERDEAGGRKEREKTAGNDELRRYVRKIHGK